MDPTRSAAVISVTDIVIRNMCKFQDPIIIHFLYFIVSSYFCH